MIPNGTQRHALYRMDGRTWIEPYFETNDERKLKLHEIQQERGWMTLIPQDKLEEFLRTL